VIPAGGFSGVSNARSAAKAVASFFATPDASTFAKAGPSP